MERRVLIAIVLSFLILLLWSKMFPPPKPEVKPAQEVSTEVPEVEPKKAPVAPEQESETTTETYKTAEETFEGGDMYPVVSGEPGKRVDLFNERVEFTVKSEGGLIDSFRLSQHVTDSDAKVELLPDHPLRIVVRGDSALTETLNRAPYSLEKRGNSVHMLYSNGNVQVTKRLSFEDELIRVSVIVEGIPGGSWGLELGPVLRELDKSEAKSKFILNAQFVSFSGEELEKRAAKKVKEGFSLNNPKDAFLGLDDRYFCSILFPESPLRAVDVDIVEEEVRIAIYPERDTFSSMLYVGGKRYDLLRSIDPRLTSLADFGVFTIIAKPMLIMLNWLYKHVANYGFAIILLTIFIRILLFPLTHKQLKSMKGMQKVQPLVEKLKSKYKKHKSDPDERAKMNQEMMALYKQEGVNPLGGCLPLVVQIPILWAFYNLLSAAIELRHAPFLLWIVDLSAPDPYYVTPILMGAAMLIQQLMTPTAGSASQRRMFLFMPIIFTFVFLGFPSGLVLYWLTNNIVQILQTYFYHHIERKEA